MTLLKRKLRKKTSPSEAEGNKVSPYEPLNIIKEHHIEKYGWGGCCIKAFRIRKSMTIKTLAERLHYRVHKLRTYEEEHRPIGIKLAKQLGEIFNVDWHIFRDQSLFSEEQINV